MSILDDARESVANQTARIVGSVVQRHEEYPLTGRKWLKIKFAEGRTWVYIVQFLLNGKLRECEIGNRNHVWDGTWKKVDEGLQVKVGGSILTVRKQKSIHDPKRMFWGTEQPGGADYIFVAADE